ncbi:uncharacterized protein E2P81_ATG00218 [Venturia nashicola]|nr:uncharacterized protein E2P81_ATG00218 [Venturia nashicola]
MAPKDIIDAYLESVSISDDQFMDLSNPVSAAKLSQFKERVTKVVDDTEPRSFFANVRLALETARKASGTPIQVLRLQIAANMSDTLPIAAYLANTMTIAIECNAWTIPLYPKLFNVSAHVYADAENIKSCKFVAIFIMSIAAPKAGALQDIKFCSMSRGGLPTLNLIRNTSTSSFRSAFDVAKTAALEHGKITVIGVAMVDVHIFKLAQRATSEQFFSFAHAFIVAIAPEGFVVWHAWGKHGYTITQ